MAAQNWHRTNLAIATSVGAHYNMHGTFDLSEIKETMPQQTEADTHIRFIGTKYTNALHAH